MDAMLGRHEMPITSMDIRSQFSHITYLPPPSPPPPFSSLPTSIRHGHPLNPPPKPKPQPRNPTPSLKRPNVTTASGTQSLSAHREHVKQIAESVETRFNCDKMAETGDDHRDSELCFERALPLVVVVGAALAMTEKEPRAP